MVWWKYLVSYHGLGRKLILLRIKYGSREKSWKISQ